MSPSKKIVSERDLKLLKDKLSAILTTREHSVVTLATSAPRECTVIARVLRNFARKIRGGRQWLAASMASLPEGNWVDNGPYMSVKDVDGASLKYCAPGQDALDAAAGTAQFRVREALCRSLADLVEGDDSKRLKAMVAWGPLRFADRERHPVLLDVAIADSIGVLEIWFYRAYANEERAWRSRFCHDEGVPTPPAVICDLADATQNRLIEPLLKAAQAASGVDSLSIRLLSNIAANRLLLESAQQTLHAGQAEAFSVELLSSLNEQGVYEVPEVIGDEEIRHQLKDWFGSKNGRLRKLERYNRRHDAATDGGLEYTLCLADQVQAQYICQRGAAMGQETAMRQFGGACNKLIFALAIAASAYAGVHVTDALYGDVSRKLPVYPARGKRGEPLSPHAADFFFAVFGHIVFSNVGWALDAKAVTAYSSALAHKRARWQELVFFLFKRQTAPGLLAMHELLASHLGNGSGPTSNVQADAADCGARGS